MNLKEDYPINNWIWYLQEEMVIGLEVAQTQLTLGFYQAEKHCCSHCKNNTVCFE